MIEVLIVGDVAEGKTSVATIIKDALERTKFKGVVLEDDIEHRLIANKLTHIRNAPADSPVLNTGVVIRTMQRGARKTMLDALGEANPDYPNVVKELTKKKAAPKKASAKKKAPTKKKVTKKKK